MKLKVVIHSCGSPPRRCRAEVPVLPGCVSEGDTPEEALANLREAIASYFDATMPTHGENDRVEEIELKIRQVERLDLRPEEVEEGHMQGLGLSSLRRFFMERGRHETAGFVALTAGLFGAMLCGTLALAPIWIGFLIGYLVMASFAALVCTVDL
jgi:predicted RNase H-like HicB family nuclease